MFVIGITGGSGAGKTAALQALKSSGALALDCDAVYHELLLSDAGMKSELGDRFEGVLDGDEIDRKLLGDIAFKYPSALRDLNAITHKYIGAEIDRRISEWAAHGGTVAAIDAIALIESGRAEKCDVVIAVTAPPEARISRIMRRDRIAREQAEMRVGAQKPDCYYAENCDHVLESDCDTPSEFNEKCKAFFSGLLNDHGVEV